MKMKQAQGVKLEFGGVGGLVGSDRVGRNFHRLIFAILQFDFEFSIAQPV